jgi:NDP-sugar pyrophosphorylase family protein
LARVCDAGRYGHICVDGDGAVMIFEEKGGQSGTGWINAGIYLFSRASLDTIPSGRAVSLERDLFPRWIGRGLYGYRSEGRFLDIGTPEAYAIAEQFLARDPQA